MLIEFHNITFRQKHDDAQIDSKSSCLCWTKWNISLGKHSFWFIYLSRLRFWYGAALGDSAMNMYQVWLCTHLNRQNHTHTHGWHCIQSLVIKFRNELPVWIFRFCYCSPVRVIYNVIVVDVVVVVVVVAGRLWQLHLQTWSLYFLSDSIIRKVQNGTLLF